MFGNFVGIGPGSGMALMFVISGILASLTALAGYSVRAIRNAEDILPDHDTSKAQNQTAQAWSARSRIQPQHIDEMIAEGLCVFTHLLPTSLRNTPEQRDLLWQSYKRQQLLQPVAVALT